LSLRSYLGLVIAVSLIFGAMGPARVWAGAALPQGPFDAPMVCPAGGHVAALRAGDLTGDGISDLLVLRRNPPRLGLLVGAGDGTFEPGPEYPLSSVPLDMAAADLDRDGRLDVAVITESGYLCILLGRDRGVFEPTADRRFDTALAAVAAGDFNGDEMTDIAVAAPGSGTVMILPRWGDGSSSPATSQPVVIASLTSTGGDVCLWAADFNRDGRDDLAVLVPEANRFDLLLGKGDGTFRPPIGHSTGDRPLGLLAQDLDHDGWPDVAVTNEVRFGPGQVWIYRGSGRGRLQCPTSHHLPRIDSHAGGMTAGDFNGDGVLDLAVACGRETVAVLPGRGEGRFGPAVAFSAGNSGRSLVSDDFNGDGCGDLALAGRGGGGIPVLLGTGDDRFFSQAFTHPTAPGPDFSVTADFNGDGRADLAYASRRNNTIEFLLGGEGGRWGDASISHSCPSPSLLVPGDFNGDGTTDLAYYSDAEDGGNVSLLLGGEEVVHRTAVIQHNSVRDMVSADFDGDGHTDLVTALIGSEQLLLMSGRGDGTFSSPVTVPAACSPRFLGCGDFNGDGLSDLALTDFWNHRVHLLLNSGYGQFIPGAQIGVSWPMRPHAADLDGDGRDDLAVASCHGSLSAIVVGAEARTWRTVELETVPGLSGVRSADFNRDDRLDLVTSARGGDSAVSVLLARGDGTFFPRMDLQLGRGPAAVPFDLDGDRWPDLAVVNFHDHSISIVPNRPLAVVDFETPEQDGEPGGVQIRLRFNRMVQEGEAAPSISLEDSRRRAVDCSCTLLGDTLLIAVPGGLVSGEEYRVCLPAGAVQDHYGWRLAREFERAFTVRALGHDPCRLKHTNQEGDGL